MLQGQSMVEQRYLAVREVPDGAAITDVVLSYGVTGGRCTAGSFAIGTRVPKSDICRTA